MSEYTGKDFLLNCNAARELYRDHAEPMPIIDYHCHLDPKALAENRPFTSITEAWLGGDHYKWRVMRQNGVDERYITGKASDYEKFERWADTLQRAMRNPLYHWTHLELSRIFGIDTVLNPGTAHKIYEECNARLAEPAFLPREILKRFRVEVVCTTDDPADSLEYHVQLRDEKFEVKVLPTWRPDKTMAIADPFAYNGYIARLEAAAGMKISTYEELIEALHKRQEHFGALGCRLSDHGIDTFPADDYTETDLMQIFAKVRRGQPPTREEIGKFTSGLLHDLAVMNHEQGWAQQFHIGAIRNNYRNMFLDLGPDAGYDALNDLPCAAAGHKFLDRLASKGELAKTILYNLNPKDNAVLAALAGTFCEGPTPGKVQFGAAWWFLDSEQGMRAQMDTLSSMGLLSRFVGMLTDSRSFLSYPRHEYFRRILCQMLGEELENGKLPRSEKAFIGQMVEDISYRNAKNYFEF